MTEHLREEISLDMLKSKVGENIGQSEWHVIDQRKIDAFADLTEDHNFIHVDPERTRSETPFPTTIAHGFLTLSLLSVLAYEAVPKVEGAIAGVNYGFDEIRFISPVPSGSSVRGKFSLAELSTRPSGHVQLKWNVEVEIEGQERPALIARWISLVMMEETSQP